MFSGKKKKNNQEVIVKIIPCFSNDVIMKEKM